MSVSKSVAPKRRSVNTKADPMAKPWTERPAKNRHKTEKPAMSKPTAKPQKHHAKVEEGRIYGANACRVLFQQRPDAIIRLYLSNELAAQFADVMKYLAANKKAYHVVDEAELEKVAGSQHHGGIVMLVKRRQILSLAAYLTHNRKKQDCLLALDGVGNPHKRGKLIYDFWVG